MTGTRSAMITRARVPVFFRASAPRASAIPFASALFPVRKCRVYVVQMPCLHCANAVFALCKCRVCTARVTRRPAGDALPAVRIAVSRSIIYIMCRHGLSAVFVTKRENLSLFSKIIAVYSCGIEEMLLLLHPLSR